MPSNIQIRMASNVTTEMVNMDSFVLKMGFSRMAIGCIMPLLCDGLKERGEREKETRKSKKKRKNRDVQVL